jgi:hypothetical protein
MSLAFPFAIRLTPNSMPSDVGALSVRKRGRTTQRLKIISEYEMLGVTANLLELTGKMEEDQMLGS